MEPRLEVAALKPTWMDLTAWSVNRGLDSDPVPPPTEKRCMLCQSVIRFYRRRCCCPKLMGAFGRGGGSLCGYRGVRADFGGVVGS